MATNTLAPERLHGTDACWRAADYRAVGQLYLYDDSLLKRALVRTEVKRMRLGHWGTRPGENFISAHVNRVIEEYELDMINVAGPGHGGPAA